MSILHFYSPSSCAICQRETPSLPLCQECAEPFQSLKISPEGRCPVCFETLFLSGCDYCTSRQVFYDSFRALFPLDETARELIHRWKFENERRLFQLFVEPLLSVISSRQMDRIGYISSGRHRRYFRAFEPVADLAMAVSAKTGIPASADIRKTRRRKQSAARYEERFFHTAGSLSLTECFSPVKQYLLLEDIFTTGATVNESARLLKKAGVASVHAIALFQRQRDGVVWNPSHEVEKEISTS